MSRFPRKRVAFWAVLLGLVFPAACGSSGVVGGECGFSHVDCDGRCVDAENDPANCGGCARACDPGVACHQAVCGGSLEGGSSGNGGQSGGDAGSGASSAASGDGTGAAAGDGGVGNLSDGGPGADASCAPPYDRPSACGDCTTQCPKAKPSCASDGLGDFHCVLACEPPPFDRPEACGDCMTKCNAATPTCSADGLGSYHCVPLCDPSLIYNTPATCGDCLTSCKAPTPNCSPDDMGSFHCVLNCTAPLKACNGRCVDFNIDADNCGSCGKVCPSGICQSGMCVGANTGHVMLACMNYQTPAKNTAQTALIGNAVLLRNDPLRILAYTEFASATTRGKVDQAIGYAAAARNRTFTITPLAKYTDASAALSITKYEVFLVYDQSSAPPGKMATVGAAWQASSVLDSFTAAGGVIIGLSGGTSEMDQFFSASKLLDVSAQTVVPSGNKLYDRAPSDALAVNVISPFAAPTDSCTFTTSVTPDAQTIFVVQDVPTGVGAPVVVHRVIDAP